MNHTPTPWKVAWEPGFNSHYIDGPEFNDRGVIICPYENGSANAASPPAGENSSIAPRPPMDKYDERAEKIAKWFFRVDDPQQRECLTLIAAALRDAVEEAFARGQDFKATCVCGPQGPCGLHEPIIKEARAEALEEAAKICDSNEYGEEFADKIRALKETK